MSLCEVPVELGGEGVGEGLELVCEVVVVACGWTGNIPNEEGEIEARPRVLSRSSITSYTYQSRWSSTGGGRGCGGCGSAK